MAATDESLPSAPPPSALSTPSEREASMDAEPALEPIVYDLPRTPTLNEHVKQLIREENAVRAQRSEKFGTDMIPVRETDILGARRAAVKDGFNTGFDVTTTEEAARRASRAARFGIPLVKGGATADADADADADAVEARALEMRRDADAGEPRRDNALHLHGADKLSTSEITRWFLPYGCSWVEWIDDSSCNVIFEDEFTVKRVLTFMERRADGNDGNDGNDDAHDSAGAASATDDAMAGDESKADAMAGDESKADAMVGDEGKTDAIVRDEGMVDALTDALKWREAQPVRGRKEKFRVWMRMATVHDRRPDAPNPKSKWSRTMRRRRGQNTESHPDDVNSRKRRRNNSGRRRSRNELRGVSSARVSKDSGSTTIDLLDRPLSSR